MFIGIHINLEIRKINDSVAEWREGGGKLLDNATWGITPQEIQPWPCTLANQRSHRFVARFV